MLCFGGPEFAGSDPRHGCMHHLSSHAVAGIPNIKWKKMGTDVSSGPISSAKRGGLAVDVSRGLIFLNQEKEKETFTEINSK